MESESADYGAMNQNYSKGAFHFSSDNEVVDFLL